MKIEIITKAAFIKSTEVEIDGIPYKIDRVDLDNGLHVSIEIPGLRHPDGTPVKQTEFVPWSYILTARVI